VGPLFHHAVPQHGVVGVSGHEQHACAAAVARQPRRELAAAHPRHHDIGEQQVDRAVVALAQLQRFLSGARLEDRVPL